MNNRKATKNPYGERRSYLAVKKDVYHMRKFDKEIAFDCILYNFVVIAVVVAVV